jgi:tetratricopeptide (TPR) repeat protein
LVSAVSNRTPALAIAVRAAEIDQLLSQARPDKHVGEIAANTEKRSVADALLHGSVWVRPRATESRSAGVLIDRDRRLVLTSAAAVGNEQVVDVVWPRWKENRLIAESAAYRDLLGLTLSGHCVQGAVLGRDLARDLALIELDKCPESASPIVFGKVPRTGDRVSAVSHPTSEELLWLYASGSIRSVGKVSLKRDVDEKAKADALLLQLPHQATASGGPIVDEHGRLVGVLSSRDDGRQHLAYSATIDEISSFLRTLEPLMTPSTAADWHARAIFLQKRGRKKGSLTAYSRAAKLSPKDATIQAAYARSLADNGQRDAALPVIEDTAKLPHRSAAANALLADAYRAISERDKAVEFANAALESDPKHVAALVTRAEFQPRDEALAALDAALSIDPNFANAYYLRATLRDPQSPGYPMNALADLMRAIEIDPYFVKARAYRANLAEPRCASLIYG